MLISDALIMIGGAAGNAATITISHLLYRYSNSFYCRMFWGNIISPDGRLNLHSPQGKRDNTCENSRSFDTLNIFYTSHNEDLFPYRLELESIMAEGGRHKLNGLFLSALLILIARRPLFASGSYTLLCFPFI